MPGLPVPFLPEGEILSSRVSNYMKTRVELKIAEPHHLNADPDPAFYFNAEPDSGSSFSCKSGSGSSSSSK
jgi:hypothetical protein